MKKILSLFIAAIFFPGMMNAEKKELNLNFRKKTSSGNSGKVDRAPMRLPVNLYYDSQAGFIEVVGDESLEADVTLCDEAGATLDYSPVVNATFAVEGINPYYVIIQGENWYATAELGY